MKRSRVTQRPCFYPAFFFFCSGSILLGALGFQYLGGLHPCPLCLYQRWPHVAVLLLAAVALAFCGRRRAVFLLILVALAYFVAAAIAGFHAGVEQKWWEGLAACSGPLTDPSKITFEDMSKAFNRPDPPRCDEIPWLLFGISMAGYNFLLSMFLGVAALFAAGRLRRLQLHNKG